MYLIWSRLAWGALYDTGIKEVMEKVTEDKANMLSHSDQIFSNAEYLYSLPGYEGNLNIYRWNYFYTPVQIGDTTVGVRIAIRDMVMPHREPNLQLGHKKSPSLGRWQPGENLPVRRCLISRGNRRLLGRCKALTK